MNILLSTDNNYTMPTGVLMYSIGVHNTSKIHYYILVEESFSDENKKALLNIAYSYKATVDFVTISSDIAEMLPAQREYQSKRITRATYFKLFSPMILPCNVSKLLYLDGDILVRHSLEDLWNTNIDDYPFAAIKDMDSHEEKRRLNLSPEAVYINAGVILMNLDYWRKHNCVKKALELIAQKEKTLVAHEQDVLNILFQGKIKLLPLTFNFQNGFFYTSNVKLRAKEEVMEIEHYKENPTILHFSTKDKPWNLECFHPFRKEWRKMLSETQWANMRLYGDERKNLKQSIRSFLIRHYLYVAKNLYGNSR